MFGELILSHLGILDTKFRHISRFPTLHSASCLSIVELVTVLKEKKAGMINQGISALLIWPVRNGCDVGVKLLLSHGDLEHDMPDTYT